ncbi:MAG: Malate/L-lactate dehydrogenase [Devosia sp.]|uniref:Ldh family oxidoreductase n=1 Tax=Devosia sp. TaxID=1871048 RepID=UPI00263019FE|nr:Ldh family oxidoreductase [Devosia sp.]MDB5586074.1 Malate/L-lactate dehydrogenase [Devosia sp.]
MTHPEQEQRLSLADIETLARDVLLASGVSLAHADAIARNVTAAEADACRSHGVYRLLGYVRAVASGKADGEAVPVVTQTSPAIVKVDAGRGFAPLANELARPALVAAAQSLGIAVLAINNCYHNSAMWVDLEPLAEVGLVSIGLTAGQRSVAPHGGSKPVFGTNPFAFGWPRPDGEPFVFDFATSAVARGEIELHQRAGKSIPLGWAVDAEGRPTTDPALGLAGAMLPFGGHKGTALALMVELLAGPMIGDLTSQESFAEDEGRGSPPLGGELIIAFDPVRFLGDDAAEHMARAETLFSSISQQDGVRLPGDRRLAARAQSAREGVLVPKRLFDELQAIRARG